jgi:hypothetical protein
MIDNQIATLVRVQSDIQSKIVVESEDEDEDEE